MGEPGPRVAYWLDACCQLLQQTHTSMPRASIVDHLMASFPTSVISYNWRDAAGRAGMELFPAYLLDAIAEHHEDLVTGRLMDQHPLLTWFATTRDPRPWTSSRVPTALVSTRRRGHLTTILRAFESDEQLSISYRLEGLLHRAFVLSRTGRDFDDEDLVVAGYVQRALRTLDHQTRLLARLMPERLVPATDLGLTGRQITVLQLVADGLSNRQIGRSLTCSPRTVEKHLERIYRKLEVADRLNALRVARVAGILPVTISADDTRPPPTRTR